MGLHAKEITESQFEVEVLRSDIPVLVDFWAPWCGPCRAIAPAVEQIAAERQGQVKVVKVNVDEADAIAATFGIQSIPTLLVFKGGKVVSTVVGAQPKAQIEAHLTRALV